MTFDKNGYLTPYEIIEISLDEFEEFFVLNLEDQTHRQKLFDSYQLFLDEIYDLIGNNFFQLINGSFTTQKLKPKDIDVVTFIDYKILNRFEDEIDHLSERSKKEFNLDAFFAPHCEPGHPYFIHAQLIFDYWKNFFSYSRKDKNGVHNPKGLFKIKF